MNQKFLQRRKSGRRKAVLLTTILVFALFSPAQGVEAAGTDTLLILGHTNDVDSAVDRMVTRAGVYAQAGGIRLEVHPSELLGSSYDLLEATMMGAIDLYTLNTSHEFYYVPETALFRLPFVFEDGAQARRLLQGELYELMAPRYNELGLHLVALYPAGHHYIYSDRPIATAQDFSGLRIRTAENYIDLAFWTAVGASPVPMSRSEVSTAMLTGTIDAYHEPLCERLIEEPPNHVLAIGHLMEVNSIVINLEAYESLTPAQRQQLHDAFERALSTYYLEFALQERAVLGELDRLGIPLGRLPDAARDEMRESALSLWEFAYELVGSDTADRFRHMVEAR